MMQISCLPLLCTVLIASSVLVHVAASEAVDDEYPIDVENAKNVLELTSATFEPALKDNKMVLVMFYAPWCGHCKKFTPEYAFAATSLKAREAAKNVAFAKIDAIANNDISVKYKVYEFPTLKWFSDGKEYPKPLKHLRTAKAIVRFVHKKLHPPVMPLESKKALKAVRELPFIVVGFFDEKETDAFKTFVDIAMDNDEVEFFYVWDKKVMQKEGVSITPTMVFYRKFDTPKVAYSGDWKRSSMEKAIEQHKRPSIMDLTEDTTPEIFENSIPKVFLVNPFDRNIYDEFEAVAKKDKYKGRYFFVTVGEEADPDFRDFLGSDPDTLEAEVFLYADDPNAKYEGTEDALKYYLPPPYTQKSIEGFIKKFKSGQLQQHRRSSKIKEGWDRAIVREIVASQWDDFVQQDKHVVVEFYDPRCAHCRALEPEYTEVAEMFKTNYPDVVIARIDGTANDIAGYAIDGYPAVYVFRRGTKHAPPQTVDRALFKQGSRKMFRALLEMLGLTDNSEKKDQKINKEKKKKDKNAKTQVYRPEL